jgi:6-phosphogluconolactonase
MKIDVLPNSDVVAQEAAKFIAAEARAAVGRRGRFSFAVSGGRTPWLMLRALASENIPWNEVHLMQVDERVAPAGHPDRSTFAREQPPWQSLPPRKGKPAMPHKDLSQFSGVPRKGGAPPRVSLTAGQCPAQSGFEDGRLF